jgi:hypothetical protein
MLAAFDRLMRLANMQPLTSDLGGVRSEAQFIEDYQPKLIQVEVTERTAKYLYNGQGTPQMGHLPSIRDDADQLIIDPDENG